MRIRRLQSLTASPVALPCFMARVACGFPSPADDHLDQPLNLSEHVISNPAATYFARAEGDSMRDFGITDGDLLIVDRSLSAGDGDVVIVALHGELVCKQLDLTGRRLLSANSAYAPITTGDLELVIEGVVTHALHYLR